MMDLNELFRAVGRIEAVKAERDAIKAANPKPVKG